MTASIRALHVLTYASGYTSWLYRTAAPFTTTTQPGYFNAMHDMVAPGDTITIVASDGTGMRYVDSTSNGDVVLGGIL